jgi:hypothetical protein
MAIFPACYLLVNERVVSVKYFMMKKNAVKIFFKKLMLANICLKAARLLSKENNDNA